MGDYRFDELTKALSTTTSRRQALKLFGAAVAGGTLSLLGARTAGAQTPGRCRNVDTVCREHEECCSLFCDPTTARCACAPGSDLCPGTGLCVTCRGREVFNPTTCECECTNPATCDIDADCCPDNFCLRVKGGGICVPAAA